MIWILVAAAVGLAVTLLGTPVAIRAFRDLGMGSADPRGRAAHPLEKVGTPTMGGIVMLVGLVAGLRCHAVPLPRRHLLHPGGGVPDPRGGRIRRRGVHRRLPEGPPAALPRSVEDVQVHRDRASSRCSSRWSSSRSPTRRARRPASRSSRPTALELGIFFYIWVFVVLTSSSHSVNLTDGLDGLAAGSAILVLAAFVFISFWEFRHTCEVLGDAVACYDVDTRAMQDAAIVGAAMMGSATGFLWWNAAPARIFMGDTGALALGGLFGGLRDHDEHPDAADHPGRPLRDRDDVGDHPGDLVPRLRPTGVPDVADPSSLRALGVAGVHRDRAVLDHRRARASPWGSACSTRTSSPGAVWVSRAVRGRARGRRGRGRRRRRSARGLSAEGARCSYGGAARGGPAVRRGELRASGIEVRAGGHDPSHLEGATLLVTGRASRRTPRSCGGRASGAPRVGRDGARRTAAHGARTWRSRARTARRPSHRWSRPVCGPGATTRLGVRQHRPLLPRGGSRGARRPGRGGVELPARAPGVVPSDHLGRC